MNQAPPRYCIDSSALSDGWTRYYKPAVHETLWTVRLPDLINAGRLIAPVEVRTELEALGGELYDWVRQHDAMFQEQTDQCQARVRAMLQRYPEFLPPQARREWADPWVIAAAQRDGGIVVTGEKFKGNGRDERPRIPDVCRGFRVPCLNTDEEPTPGLFFMMEKEGWVF